MGRSYVKKAAALALALVMALLLPGCGVEGSAWQETPVVPQTNESLSVFCMGGLKDSKMIQVAMEQYQSLYPEVEVELVQSGPDDTLEMNDERYRQMAAQVMAGEGPDVFIIDSYFMDVEKLVRQGIFADMEPYFEADNFDWEPYNQAVMDGGVWNGKRFVIPLSYNFPLLFTTRSALEETGFDVDACGDFQGFLEETTRFLESEGRTRQLFYNPSWVTKTVTDSGLAIADYDARTIDLSSPLLEDIFQWRKTIIEMDPNCQGTFSGGLLGAADVRDGKVLWASSLMGPLDGLYYNYGALKTLGKELVMMPIRDINGGIQAEIVYPVAVRANSENLQNAYHFIKLLLSPSVQYTYNWQELSVLDSANEHFYNKLEGFNFAIAGTDGFTGLEDPYSGTDYPTWEEFEQVMGYTQEITGTYYDRYLNRLGLYREMRPFEEEGADFDETLAEAQRQLERYIAE